MTKFAISIALASLVCSILSVNAANACFARISERKLFVVNVSNSEVKV